MSGGLDFKEGKSLKRMAKVLNHKIHMEQRIIDLLKSLKNQNEISEKNYDNLYPSGSKPGIIYGHGKIVSVRFKTRDNLWAW